MNKAICYILLIFSLISCKPDLNYEIRGYTQKIIVEGYIANGEFPSVYLSLNVPLSKKVDSVSILENVIRTAKVTISDGETTEILTSGWDKTHFPPYVYRGTELKGVEGKTYYLTVNYSSYTLYAQTTIPHATNILNFNTEQVVGNDSMRLLTMTFDIDAAKKNGYRVFTKKKKDGHYIQTPIVFNSEFSLSGTNTFTISPKPDDKDPSSMEGSYFAIGDTVQVKLCTIDSVSTQFFKALTIFSASGIGSNFFIGEKDALKSNISSPGFGIWYGNGTKTYQVIIK
jgi:hypothetical protein